MQKQRSLERASTAASQRGTPRIEPPCPVTVAVDDDEGRVLAYGVLFDVSKTGGCIWTDVLMTVGETVHLRLSFVDPPEIHRLVATVAWARADSTAPGRNAFSCGLEWLGVGHALRERLRQLANAALPAHEKERFVFERRWAVASSTWPSSHGAVQPTPGVRRGVPGAAPADPLRAGRRVERSP